MNPTSSSAAESGATRLVALDGLRGIAAIIVLMFHFEQSHGTRSLFASGYLAVDFFFLLSGFVLVGPIEGRAHERRRGGLAIFAARFLRFWPLMALGTAIGAGVQFLDYPAEQILPLLALAWLSIPLAWQAGDAFALNGPQWSLFVELVWNALHIALLRRLSVPALLALSFGFGLVVTVGDPWLNTQTLGREYDEIIIGLLRAGFAYPLGIVIARKQHLLLALPMVAGWIAPSLLVGAIVVPTMLGFHGAMADLFARVAFVVVLVLGVRSRLTENTARSMAWLGAISFPLYAVHAPILNLADMAGRAAPPQLRPLIYLAGPALVVALAHLLSRSGLARGIRLPTRNRAGVRQSGPLTHGG